MFQRCFSQKIGSARQKGVRVGGPEANVMVANAVKMAVENRLANAVKIAVELEKWMIFCSTPDEAIRRRF